MTTISNVDKVVQGVLLASILMLASCGRVAQTASPPDPPALPTVGVAEVTRQDLSHDLEIAAEFRPYQEIDVYSKVAGFVKTISVDYGDRVKQGQVLAVLEVPELVDELERSVAATKQAEEEVSAAQGELVRAESAHKVAHLEYTRLAGVMDKRPGLVAQQDVDGALGKDQESEAKIDADKAAAAAAQQQLQVAKANERKVRTLLAYTQITAPFRGVITKRYADTGAMIQQGISSHTQAMPLVRLAQSDDLRLVIPVPESAVPRVKLGEPVEVTVAALARTFKGRVARFSDQLDLETRTMHTEVDVPNPDLILVPGMYATARLPLERKVGALVVPVQAIGREEGKTTAYCVGPDGRIEEHPIRLGLETADMVEVLSGLQEKDQVVVGDRSKLKPGEVVHPKIIKAKKGT
jgi:RND family efflux transporter MFP subunit